jgi:glutaredoxin/ribosomal protein L37AE/L43A
MGILWGFMKELRVSLKIDARIQGWMSVIADIFKYSITAGYSWIFDLRAHAMTICPKCHHVRQPTDTAPSWQCPACGVAYTKALAAAAPPPDNAPYDARTQARRKALEAASQPAAPTRTHKPLWLVLCLAAFTAYAIWSGVQAALGPDGGASRQELRALAAAVRPGEVVMYSTQSCGYCVQAKYWLHRYGFAFTECDIEREARCESEFEALGAQGTPFLVVRGQPMDSGFDAEEFVALLRRKPT